MPAKLSAADVTDITYTGSGSNGWELAIKSGSTVLGQFENGVGYTDGSEIVASQISITFIETDSFDFVYGEYITITYDGVTVDIELEEGIQDLVPYYIDTNGVLWKNSELTNPLSICNITNESMFITEETDVDLDEGETLESISINESTDNDSYGTTEEIIVIVDSHSSGMGNAWTETIPGSTNSGSWTEKDGNI